MDVDNKLICGLRKDIIEIMICNFTDAERCGMIRRFGELTKEEFQWVGGKGYNLGILLQAGLPVPDGFCVLTKAFDQHLENCGLADEVSALNGLDPEDLVGIETAGNRIRQGLTAQPMDENLKGQVIEALKLFGMAGSFAIRSSATAEDLAEASFAGQQDSFLFVEGRDAVLADIRRCWASLFNNRAIAYRLKNGISNTGLSISVVVQQMVNPLVSGVAFTVDPLSEHRDRMMIEYVGGTGEDLVSGKRIPNTVLFDKKKGMILSHALDDGADAMTDDQLSVLANLAEEIETLYEKPMDIEWSLDREGNLWILQARAITTLLPLIDPERTGNGVYFSFHHVQNMMEPIRPLGISCLKRIFPFDRDEEGKSQMLLTSGSYLFMDATDYFAVPAFRKTFGNRMNVLDAVMAGSMQRLLHDRRFVKGIVPKEKKGRQLRGALHFLITGMSKALRPKNMRVTDCDAFVEGYMKRFKAELDIAKTPLERLAVCQKAISAYLPETIQNLVPYIGPGMLSYVYLVKKTEKLFGSDHLAQTLAKGLKGNATTEMGLSIGDLAERIREDDYWRKRLDVWDPKVFVEELLRAEGAAGDQMRLVMEKYGARGIGEIDITNLRWFEDPSAIVLSVKNHLRIYAPDQHRLEYNALTEASLRAGEELVDRASRGRNWWKRRFYQNMVDRVLYLLPAREHGKYGMILVLGQVKKVVLETGRLAADRGLLNRVEDCNFLKWEEIIEMVREEKSMQSLVKTRRQAFEKAGAHKIPRVVTNRGWIVPPKALDRDLQANELAGSGVSSGVYEGVARVVQRPEQARLEPGEILVAPFTDPGWTPLFIHAKGLVLEVGGLLIHGAIVAREYGIPAVVGVDRAMEKIKTGDWIRVDGNTGLVTILERGHES